MRHAPIVNDLGDVFPGPARADEWNAPKSRGLGGVRIHTCACSRGWSIVAMVLLLLAGLGGSAGASAQAAAMTIHNSLASFADNDGNGYVSVGDVLTIDNLLTNTGSVTLTNVSYHDPKTLIQTCAIGTLAPAATLDCGMPGPSLWVYRVTQADANAGMVVFTVSATSTEVPGPITSVLSVPVITPAPTLTVSKALTGNTDGDHNGQVTLGDVLTYKVTATNAGNIQLTNVTVNDPLTAPNAITCATLAPGAACVLTGTHTVSAADVDNGSISNTGHATAAQVSGSIASPTVHTAVGKANDFTNLPGLTPQEQQVANALDNACPTLAIQGTLTPAQADLLARCRDIDAASFIDGNAAAYALGQLVAQNSEVQSNAAVTAAVTQFQNISLRLAALRSSSKTSSLSGLTFAGPNGVIPVASLIGAFLGDADKPDKQIGADFSRWGFFATGTIGRGTADPRAAAPGYAYDINGLTAGVDYRKRDNLVYGAALGYSRQNSDLDQGRGNVNLTGWNISTYGTYSFKNNLYLDGVLTWGSNQFDMTRRIDYTLPVPGGGTTSVHQIASGQPNGGLFSGTLTFGGDFHKNAWNFSPYGELTYGRMRFDSYREKLQSGVGNGLGLAVDARTDDTLSTVLGAKVSWTHSTNWGVLIPTGSLEWQHDFKSDQQTIIAHFINDPTQTGMAFMGVPLDSDFFRVGLGLSAVFPHGRSGFILFEHTLGRTGMSEDNLGVGIRIEF